MSTLPNNFMRCALVCPLLIIFGVFVVIRTSGIIYDDKNYTCEGKVCSISGVQKKHNMRRWYFKYSLIFEQGNPSECIDRNNTVYQSSLFKNREDAVNFSVLFQRNNTFVVKTYPTETRELLNLLTFLFSLMILFICFMTSSNAMKNNERQRLLSCYS